MLFNCLVSCFQVYQSLHQFYYKNKDITMHYTQIKVAPLSIIEFTPTRLLIKNELKVVDKLTANNFGEIYMRYPIFNDDDVYVRGINVTHNNITQLINLDEQTQLTLSTMDVPDNDDLSKKLK